MGGLALFHSWTLEAGFFHPWTGGPTFFMLGQGKGVFLQNIFRERRLDPCFFSVLGFRGVLFL